MIMNKKRQKKIKKLRKVHILPNIIILFVLLIFLTYTMLAFVAVSFSVNDVTNRIAWFNEALRDEKIWESKVEETMERALVNNEFQKPMPVSEYEQKIS